MQNLQNLKLSLIQSDMLLEPRAEFRDDWVGEYALDMENGAAFPPIVVFFDGTSYWLADGFHRTGCSALALKKKGLRRQQFGRLADNRGSALALKKKGLRPWSISDSRARRRFSTGPEEKGIETQLDR